MKRTAKWALCCVVILLVTLVGGQNTLTQAPPTYPLGDIPIDPETYQRYLKVWPEETLESLPPSYDARAYGWVTPAKNQASCGSCWAFASVGAMESHLLKAYGVGPTDLSEQQQVSCNLAQSGCAGGSSTAILYWGSKGPLYEACFPYTGSDATACAEPLCEQLGYRVIDFHTVANSPADYKTSLYTYGPSYWRYTVYSDFDTYWSSAAPGAVYVSQAGATYRGGHAVLLIGWDDAKGAYLCKNSWGTYGGPNDDGTFWIAYTGHYNNLGFGMSNFSLTPVGCSSNADCDDGLYCNGAETCSGSVCQNGAPPNCSDDGLFCNGTELCDEANDTCGHTGDPCGAGTVCNEDQNQCLPLSCGNTVCDAGESCTNCPLDCISGTGGTCATCFKGVCNGACTLKDGPTCADCVAGYCCGDGTCSGQESNSNCAIDCPPPVCGDGDCQAGETQCTCSADCGLPPATEVGLCSNGVNDDCDLAVDCDDLDDCSLDPVCTCLPKGALCSSAGECCSAKCRGGVCR